MSDEEVIFEVKAALVRRLIAIAALLFSGACLIYLALNGAVGGFLLKILMIAAGAAILVFAEWFRRTTGAPLELTEDGLREANGRWLCQMDDVVKVDRGIIAMKPSNGFLIRLKDKANMQWSPGMWWRLGATIGVGGVTDRYMSRAVAEYMALAIAERDKPKDEES